MRIILAIKQIVLTESATVVQGLLVLEINYPDNPKICRGSKEDIRSD